MKNNITLTNGVEGSRETYSLEPNEILTINITEFVDNDYYYKVNSDGIIFLLDTLPFWYMVEILDDNGNLIRREFKKFKEFDKDYRQ